MSWEKILLLSVMGDVVVWFSDLAVIVCLFRRSSGSMLEKSLCPKYIMEKRGSV
jgi:hypothetical protein